MSENKTVAVPVAYEGPDYLVTGWGETDRPEVMILPTLADAKKAVVAMCFGDYESGAAQASEEGLLDGLDADSDLPWKRSFEIGGVSVEQVYLRAAPAATAQDDRAAWALRQIAQLDPKTGSIGTAVFMAKETLKWIAAVTADASLCLAQQDEREAFEQWVLEDRDRTFRPMIAEEIRDLFQRSRFEDRMEGHYYANSWLDREYKVWQARAALTASSEATAPQDVQERDVWIAYNSVDDDEAVMFFTELPGQELKERFVLKHYKCRPATAQPADKPEAVTTVIGKAEQQAEPGAWDVFYRNGRLMFKIGVQSFMLDYTPEDEPEMSAGQQAEWMATQLRNALSKLAASPAQPQGLIKDHVIAQTVNQLRDIAIEFHATQQLRARIAEVIVPFLSRQSGERN